jgi:two-component system response regulator YesN
MQKRFELSVIDTRDLQIASLLGTRVKGKLPAALRTLRWPMYRVLLLKPYAMDSNSARPELIKLQLKRYFEKSERGIVFHMNSKVGILLRETKEGFDGNRLFCDLEEALAVINTTFIAVAGGAVEEIANLWRSYSDAETLIKNEFLYRGERKVIDSSSIVRSQAALDLGMLSDKLCYAMDIGNRSILSRMLVEGLHAIAQFDGEEQAIKTAASQWISLSLTKLTKTNDEAYLAVQDVLSITSDIYIQPDYQTLVRMLEVRLMELLARIDSDRRDPVIKQLIDFIDRHYSENLKLETLAELFHYNSGYLGRLFKNATGDTFRTYLDKVRIESAKLLLESGLKVHQVASRVGISNVNYFNVKFKKYTGKKPSLFKAKLLRENECRQYGENT